MKSLCDNISRCAREWDGWGRISDDGSGHYNPDLSEGPWGGGRLIRDAFAVRERLSDPRVVPGFRCPFRPDMPPSLTPGSSIVVSVQNTDVDIGLRHGPKGSALPMFPQSVSRGARFRGYSGSQLLRPVRLLAPQYGPDRSPGQRGLLLPGFQRVGRPSRCWI